MFEPVALEVTAVLYPIVGIFTISGKGISTPMLDPSAFSKVRVPSENAPFPYSPFYIWHTIQ